MKSVTGNNKLLFYCTLSLVIIYFFGVLGLLSPWKELFLLATPLNLIISLTLLIVHQEDRSRPFIIFSILCFLGGYFVEVAGVSTRSIFGDYEYGPTLGPAILDVPLLMGVNWLTLIIATGAICDRLRTNIFFKSLLGAAMLIILDYFIEPVAIKYGFWSWKGNPVPLQNYVAWYLCALILLLMYYSFRFRKGNKLATALFIVQFVFFILLNIF